MNLATPTTRLKASKDQLDQGEKRTRGRPKKNRIVSDVRDDNEAQQTWDVGRQAGMQCSDNDAVIKALRRSQRNTKAT